MREWYSIVKTEDSMMKVTNKNDVLYVAKIFYQKSLRRK